MDLLKLYDFAPNDKVGGKRWGPVGLTIVPFTKVPRTPNHSLFPYTTLFRSELRRKCDLRNTHLRPSAKWLRNARRLRLRIDRKSTRLNSSHQIISYAVFCLKKKKKNSTYYINSDKLRKVRQNLCLIRTCTFM